MSPEALVQAALAGLFGGFINGFAGTGTALFGMGFMLGALPPAEAVMCIAIQSVLAGLQGLWAVRATLPIARRRILRVLLPGLLGLPLGLMAVPYIGSEALRLMVAGLLIVYGGFFGFRRALPRLDHPMPRRDAAIGFVSGGLGGLAALSGALPAIWLSMRGWPKTETRAVLQSFNIGILLVTAISLAATGHLTREALIALSVALPVAIVAARIGIWLFGRLSDDQFRRTLILLCLAMGLGIAAAELF